MVETPVPELGPGEALLEVKYVGDRPDDPGLAGRARQLHAGRPDRRGHPLQRCRRGRRDERRRAAIRSVAPSWPSSAGSSTGCSRRKSRIPSPCSTRTSSCWTRCNVLGHVGLTAYLGVTEVARPESGEMFLVSAAASGVGAVAGQIAKLRGARVIGIAGGPEKCAWVVDELGFDACIDYKSEDVAARLKELAPQGVDVFFDNVGGELLDTVLRRLAQRGRVVLCGDISTYNLEGAPPPLRNLQVRHGEAGAHGGLQHAGPLGLVHRQVPRSSRRGSPTVPSSTVSMCSRVSIARRRRWCACSAATISASSSYASTDGSGLGSPGAGSGTSRRRPGPSRSRPIRRARPRSPARSTDRGRRHPCCGCGPRRRARTARTRGRLRLR